MRTFFGAGLPAFFAFVALLSPVAPLEAQEVQAEHSRSGEVALQGSRFNVSGRELARNPLVAEALRSHGLRPERLTRAQERALEQTHSELFPEGVGLRHRLNRTQATALVYMALVHPARRDQAGNWPRRPACERAADRVFELEELFDAPGRGQPRFLRRDEQEALVDEARGIERLARGCGEHRLAEEASQLVSLTSAPRSDREQVARQVQRMKGVVRVALGR